MQPIISVVIPVYNKEKYLHRCLDSVTGQTIFKQLEVIIIDDGSTDNSFIIMQEYQQKHSNINIFQQKNVGVSATRNRGISLSRGKYIYFIDADDFMDINMLEILCESAIQTNSDIVVCNLKIYNSITSKTSNYNTKFKDKYLFDKQESIILLTDAAIGWSVCNKLYKLEFIRKNQIGFDERISLAEDFLFNFNVIFQVEKALFLNQHLYYYVRMIKNSLTRVADNRLVIDGLELIEKADLLWNMVILDKEKREYRVAIDSLIILVVFAKYYDCIMQGVEIESNVKQKLDKSLRERFINALCSQNLALKSKLKLIFHRIGIYPLIFKIYYKLLYKIV